MADRWFTEAELRDMSRPTADRALEALDAGAHDEARALLRSLKGEWQMLHDLYAESTAALLTFIKDELGEDAIRRAHEVTMERTWRRHARL